MHQSIFLRKLHIPTLAQKAQLVDPDVVEKAYWEKCKTLNAKRIHVM